MVTIISFQRFENRFGVAEGTAPFKAYYLHCFCTVLKLFDNDNLCFCTIFKLFENDPFENLSEKTKGFAQQVLKQVVNLFCYHWSISAYASQSQIHLKKFLAEANWVEFVLTFLFCSKQTKFSSRQTHLFAVLKSLSKYLCILFLFGQLVSLLYGTLLIVFTDNSD